MGMIICTFLSPWEFFECTYLFSAVLHSRCVDYLSAEMPRCLLRSPHRSIEYCLFLAALILPILWREHSAQGSPFPPNVIIWSGLICTAMYWKIDTELMDSSNVCCTIATIIIGVNQPHMRTSHRFKGRGSTTCTMYGWAYRYPSTDKLLIW